MDKIQLIIFDWEGTLMAPSHALFPGVKEMLLTLKDTYLLAVATNRYRRSLDRLINQTHLDNIFITTRCADETQPKPDPQMLTEILEELAIPAAQALMIGDSESDMLMAKRVAMQRVAIGIPPAVNALLKHHPIYCLQSVTELPKSLLTIAKKGLDNDAS
jgi:phosphoglycolate phosphatase